MPSADAAGVKPLSPQSVACEDTAMITTDPGIGPTGPPGSTGTDRSLGRFVAPGRNGLWSVPVWLLSLDGRGLWCNSLAEAWVRGRPESHGPSALTGGDDDPSALAAALKRTLAEPGELPRRAAIHLPRRRLEVLVSQLDDASGRQVGILVTAVPPGGNGR